MLPRKEHRFKIMTLTSTLMKQSHPFGGRSLVSSSAKENEINRNNGIEIEKNKSYCIDNRELEEGIGIITMSEEDDQAETNKVTESKQCISGCNKCFYHTKETIINCDGENDSQSHFQESGNINNNVNTDDDETDVQSCSSTTEGAEFSDVSESDKVNNHYPNGNRTGDNYLVEHSDQPNHRRQTSSESVHKDLEEKRVNGNMEGRFYARDSRRPDKAYMTGDGTAWGLVDDSDDDGPNYSAPVGATASLQRKINSKTGKGDEPMNKHGNDTLIHKMFPSSKLSLDLRDANCEFTQSGENGNGYNEAKPWKIYTVQGSKQLYRVVRQSRVDAVGVENTDKREIRDGNGKKEVVESRRPEQCIRIRGGKIERVVHNVEEDETSISVKKLDLNKMTRSSDDNGVQPTETPTKRTPDTNTNGLTGLLGAHSKQDEVSLTDEMGSSRRHRRGSIRLIDHLEMRELSSDVSRVCSEKKSEQLTSRSRSCDHPRGLTFSKEDNANKPKTKTLEEKRHHYSRSSEHTESFPHQHHKERLAMKSSSTNNTAKQGSAGDMASDEGYRGDDDHSTAESVLSSSNLCHCHDDDRKMQQQQQQGNYQVKAVSQSSREVSRENCQSFNKVQGQLQPLLASAESVSNQNDNSGSRGQSQLNTYSTTHPASNKVQCQRCHAMFSPDSETEMATVFKDGNNVVTDQESQTCLNTVNDAVTSKPVSNRLGKGENNDLGGHGMPWDLNRGYKADCASVSKAHGQPGVSPNSTASISQSNAPKTMYTVCGSSYSITKAKGNPQTAFLGDGHGNGEIPSSQTVTKYEPYCSNNVLGHDDIRRMTEYADTVKTKQKVYKEGASKTLSRDIKQREAVTLDSLKNDKSKDNETELVASCNEAQNKQNVSSGRPSMRSVFSKYPKVSRKVKNIYCPQTRVCLQDDKSEQKGTKTMKNFNPAGGGDGNAIPAKCSISDRSKIPDRRVLVPETFRQSENTADTYSNVYTSKACHVNSINSGTASSFDQSQTSDQSLELTQSSLNPAPSGTDTPSITKATFTGNILPSKMDASDNCTAGSHNVQQLENSGGFFTDKQSVTNSNNGSYSEFRSDMWSADNPGYGGIDKNASRRSQSTDRLLDMIRVMKQKSRDSARQDSNISNASHPSNGFLSDYIVCLWENQWLCDVEVTVNNTQILAHKLILAAFSDVFCPNTPNPAPSVVLDVPDTTPEAVEQLFRYMYTCCMDLTDQLLEPVLCAALYLGVSEVICLVTDILHMADASNLQMYMEMCARRNIAFRFSKTPAVQKQMCELVKQDFFTSITFQQMHMVLDDPGVEVESEEVTLRAVMQWASPSPCDAADLLPDLLCKISLESIPPKRLQAVINDYPGICHLPLVQELFLNTFQFHATLGQPDDDAMNCQVNVPPLTNPNEPHCDNHEPFMLEDMFGCQGGTPKGLVIADARNKDRYSRPKPKTQPWDTPTCNLQTMGNNFCANKPQGPQGPQPYAKRPCNVTGNSNYVRAAADYNQSFTKSTDNAGYVNPQIIIQRHKNSKMLNDAHVSHNQKSNVPHDQFLGASGRDATAGDYTNEGRLSQTDALQDPEMRFRSLATGDVQQPGGHFNAYVYTGQSHRIPRNNVLPSKQQPTPTKRPQGARVRFSDTESLPSTPFSTTKSRNPCPRGRLRQEIGDDFFASHNNNNSVSHHRQRTRRSRSMEIFRCDTPHSHRSSGDETYNSVARERSNPVVCNAVESINHFDYDVPLSDSDSFSLPGYIDGGGNSAPSVLAGFDGRSDEEVNDLSYSTSIHDAGYDDSDSTVPDSRVEDVRLFTGQEHSYPTTENKFDLDFTTLPSVAHDENKPLTCLSPRFEMRKEWWPLPGNVVKESHSLTESCRSLDDTESRSHTSNDFFCDVTENYYLDAEERRQFLVTESRSLSSNELAIPQEDRGHSPRISKSLSFLGHDESTSAFKQYNP